MASVCVAVPVALGSGRAEMLLGPPQCWFVCSCSEPLCVARNAGLTIKSAVEMLQ